MQESVAATDLSGIICRCVWGDSRGEPARERREHLDSGLHAVVAVGDFQHVGVDALLAGHVDEMLGLGTEVEFVFLGVPDEQVVVVRLNRPSVEQFDGVVRREDFQHVRGVAAEEGIDHPALADQNHPVSGR